MVSRDEALREMARRELARRREAQAQPAEAPQAPQQSEQPWYSQLEQAADDILRLGSNAVTFGFRDKLAPYLSGRTVEEERDMTREARDRAGSAGLATELLAGAAVPVGAAKAGYTALNAVPSTLRGASGLAARTGAMAGEGALYGGLSAAGNDQDMLTGMGLGAAAGAAGNLIGEGVSSGVNKVAGAFNKKPPQVTAAQLNRSKEAAYNASEKAGVIIKPEGMKRLSDRVEADLADFGYDADLHPGAKAVLKKIREKQGQNVTLKGLDVIRKTAGNAYIQGNKSNNAAVSKIVKRIDELIDVDDPALMAGIDTKAGTSALKLARQYAHRANKLETAEKLVAKGNQQADRNITDTRVKSVKSQLAKINDPFSSWGRGFTEAEKKAAAKAARYTTPQRALHGASVLNPFGGGKLSAAGHLAAGAANLATGNLPGLVLQGAGAAGGAGLQKAGEALANKSVREFVDLVARGGVPAPVMQNAVQLLAQQEGPTLARALMALGISQTIPAR